MRKRNRRCMGLPLALLCLILLSGCSVSGDNSMYVRLRQGKVIEAFDTQAVPALEAGLAQYWYPQSQATVVIAVDREKTDAEIGGWRDLGGAGAIVGFDDTPGNCEMMMAAMAYGLDKASGLSGSFTLRGAARLLAGLRAKGLFALGSFDAPIVICFDTQAPPGMEIIVPREGTLTYVKGLLSNHPLDIEGDAGLAATFTEYGRLNTVCRDAVRVLRRSVLRTRALSTADGREDQLLVLLYIILVTIWTASVIRRAMQKGVRRASLLMGVLLLGWSMARLLKYQMPLGAFSRYFWYGYYLFLLALPLALLWLAWVIDRSEDKVTPPKWYAVPVAVSGAMLALVFTNDRHNWVFRLDLSNPNWHSEYSYGPGYYLVMGVGVAMALTALVLLMVKSGRTPRKGRVIFPLALCVLMTAYGVGFLLHVPFVWESDVTMVYGLFALLFLETSIRAGMIPVNSKYKLLFTHSPLAMRIHDGADDLVLSSASNPLRRDGDTLLFTAPIAGGRVLWQEDITALNRLHREVEEHTRRLEIANAMLAEEETIKRAVEEEKARAQILRQLESEIARHTARLSGMIESRESAARIALLVCYIKRRCNLFFRDRETQSLPADELAVYLDELAEFAGYAGLRIVMSSQLQAPVVLRRAALFYDVFYSAADGAAPGAGGQGSEESHMLASLECGGGTVVMRLQYAGETFQAEHGLAEAVAAADGVIEVKDLGDAVGINLAFPEGGAAIG